MNLFKPLFFWTNSKPFLLFFYIFFDEKLKNVFFFEKKLKRLCSFHFLEKIEAYEQNTLLFLSSFYSTYELYA